MYFIRNLESLIKLAYELKDIESSIQNQYTFVLVNCDHKNKFCVNILRKFFTEFADGKGVVLIPEELYVNRTNFIDRKITLDEFLLLQHKNKCLEIYQNLSNRS